ASKEPVSSLDGTFPNFGEERRFFSGGESSRNVSMIRRQFHPGGRVKPLEYRHILWPNVRLRLDIFHRDLRFQQPLIADKQP
ncbi:hypothetical protein K0M31_010472, partial [Melipona bicolor]